MNTSFKIVFLAYTFLLTSCNSNSTISNYNLNVFASPIEGGIVTPGSGTFDKGSLITLQAKAQEDYLFSGWSGDITISDNPTQLVMNGDKSITAHFDDISSSRDWDAYPLNAEAGEGKQWRLQEDVSDDFNYDAPAEDKGQLFSEKWDDWYHNAWTGPGLTIWSRNNSYVEKGMLTLFASRVNGTNKVNTGILTSKKRIQYPVYIETRAKIANSVIASNAWMLSPDDTQEIDFLESYGGSFSENAGKDQSWYAKRIHISHHVFIRNPFQDYQPTDSGSWYTDGTTLWRNDFHTYGVYWIDPWNLEYYIDGKMVRKVSGAATIDPKNFTNGTGLSKEMDIIINMEDQDWRSNQGITPTDEELSILADNIFLLDWIRVYKPE